MPCKSMHDFSVYGIDFTSRPTRRKPITCARAVLDGVTLRVTGLEWWEDFRGFEAFLMQPGPWYAGMDFSFGQPRKLLSNLGCATTWEDSVKWLTKGDRKAFEKILTDYRTPRPKGDKQHRRVTDELADSCSPMMLYGVPVAKMFYEGAPRLLASGASILPVRPVPCEKRTVVEAYPKLVAKRYGHGTPYKAEARRKQTATMCQARVEIIEGLASRAIRDYGFHVEIPDDIRERALADASGDTLDAILCAVQAAWSHRSSDPPHGIPTDCDRMEGWIVDPELLSEVVNLNDHGSKTP